MKSTRKILVLAFIIGIVFILPVAAQKTKSDFQKMYMDFLKKKGYSPSIDNDGDILFRIEGYTFYVLVREKEPKLFEIIHGTDVSEIPMQKCLEAANYANINSDGASVCIVSNPNGKVVIFSVVTIVLKPKDFQLVFPTILEIIEDAADAFGSQL